MQSRTGKLQLCLLPTIVATLPGTVVVRLLHELNTGAFVHVAVASGQEPHALVIQCIHLQVITILHV